MEFKFAVATEVTDLAFDINPDYEKSGYTRVFLTPDVKDTHLLRVLPGYNKEYEKEEGSIILEYKLISNRVKGEKMSITKAKRLLGEDEFDNWDYDVFYSLGEVLEHIDGGFGILNQKIIDGNE